jgi:hypothetical protein
LTVGYIALTRCKSFIRLCMERKVLFQCVKLLGQAALRRSRK